MFKFGVMARSIKAPVIFTAKDRFSPAMRRMSRNVTGFASKASVGVARVEHRFNRLMRPINSTIRQLGSLGIIAGGLAFGAVFSSITDFETGLVGVSKTTGIVGDELEDLSKDFIVLSDEMRGVSTKTLLEVGQAAGQLGVKGSDNILKFSKVMAQLEKATDVVGEEGAKNIARLLTNTGEGVGVIDKFGSALTALGNDSAATEGEILNMASEVARGTSAYKLQSKEILGLSATLKSLGMRAEGAGTAVSKTFRTIEMATLNGGEELEKFAEIMGSTTEQVIEDFEKNPRVAFDKFISGLSRIQKEGGSVSKVMQEVGLTGEGVSKTIIPLASNFQLLQKNQALSSDEFEKNIALQNEFDAASKTVDTALTDIQKSFTNVILSTATAGSGLDNLQEVLFFVSDNMETLIVAGASLVGMFLLIKGVIIASKVALAAYNIVMGISTAITQNNKRALIGNAIAQGAYRVAMVAGAAATGIATAAQWLFAAAMNASIWPITLVVAAIAAIIAVIMNWSSITEWFSKKWDEFTSFISSVWAGVVAVFEEFDFEGFFKSIGNSVIDFLLTPLKSVLFVMSKIPGTVGDLAQTGLDVVNKIGFDTENNQEESLPSTSQASSQETNKALRDSRLNIDIRDKGNNIEKAEKDGQPIPINMNKTVGAF